MNIIRVGLFVLALSLLPSAAHAADSGDASAAPSRITLNKIAAVINGEIITLHDLRQRSAGELKRAKINPADPAARNEINAVMSRVLTTMTENILLHQEADRLKIKVTDAEVENELRMLIQRSQMNAKDFERRVITEGGSLEAIKENIRKEIVSQRIIGFMIARKVVVTPDEVKAYFDEHQNEFSADKMVDVSLIVFPPSVKASVQAGRIKSGKLAFAEAAKRSVGPAPNNGGNLGQLRWEELAPPIKAAVAPLQDGEMSDLFRINDHDALIRLNSTTHGRQMTLEEATPEIERILRQPRLQERFDDYMQQLRSKAVIDIRI